jgi:hypothetical protein
MYQPCPSNSLGDRTTQEELMGNDIPQTPSVVPEVTEPIQQLQPGPPSTRSFFKTARFRFGLAASGVMAVGAALWLRRKRRAQPVSAWGDQDVEDFTANQVAMLSRVREICNEISTDTESAEKSDSHT